MSVVYECITGYYYNIEVVTNYSRSGHIKPAKEYPIQGMIVKVLFLYK